MGLGTLLLNSEEIASRLRGNESGLGINPRQSTKTVVMEDDLPAATDVESTNMADPQPTPTANPEPQAKEARFVIMWPALGCPQLVDPNKLSLEIIFISKEETKAINRALILEMLQHILVLEWNDVRKPYRVDNNPWNIKNMRKTTLAILLEPGNSIKFQGKPMSLEEYKNKIKKRPLRFGEFLHTMNDIVLKAYISKGFKSIASIRLILKDSSAGDNFKLEPGRMYNLYYAQENSLLRSILIDPSILKKPYSDIRLMDITQIGGPEFVYGWRYDYKKGEEKSRCGSRKREHLVRLFHPFMIVRKEADKYLNVGHLTDPHISSTWDYFDEKAFPEYNQDQEEIRDKTGRNPKPDAVYRYNNPNVNTRNLTYLLNNLKEDDIDIIVQTGDLIDFNRGFNLNPTHEPDMDYFFNLNWIRYYELLLLDYERPTYTLLGNHDWRLNPYPPIIEPEIGHYFLIALLIVIGAAIGATYGLIWGSLEEADISKAVSFFLLFLIFPIVCPLMLLGTIILLGGFALGFSTTFAFLVTRIGLNILIFGGIGFGCLMYLTLLILSVSKVDLKGAGKGTLWGTIIGGSFGLIGFIFLFILIIISGKRSFMSEITNLTKDVLSSLLDKAKKVKYLTAFGKDGLLYMSERSFDWYSLVINPFSNYVFWHGNTEIIMMDWVGDEILTGDPPMADDVFSKRQWKLFSHSKDSAIKLCVDPEKTDELITLILALHTPVFCPNLDVDLDDLNRHGKDIYASSITRGTMEDYRKELIKTLFELAQGLLSNGKTVQTISLTGHTHDYDIFRVPDLKKVFWYQEEEHFKVKDKPDFWNKGLHITTTCAGPPSDGEFPKREDRLKILKKYEKDQDSAYDKTDKKAGYKKGQRVRRSSGCRVLLFDGKTGRLKSLNEISALTAEWGF